MRNVCLACLLTLSSIVSLQAADLDMAGLDTPADKLPAARRLLSWLKSLGYESELSKDGEEVFVSEYKLRIYPVLNAAGIDRLIVISTYGGFPENVRNQALLAEIARLNSQQHAAHLALTSNGGVMFVSSLTFDESLSPRLFRLFMEHANMSASSIIDANPKLAACIK